jgi:hypothetical protein
MKNFNESVTEMFKGDTDGGATPEETFNLFVSALKNENIDLAVKYIVLDVERRQRYYDDFNKMKEEGKLREYAEKLPTWDKWDQIKDNYNNWENRATIESSSYYSKSETINLPDGAGGYLETELPPGDYVDYSMILVKNQNNIWKIESF